MKTPCGKRSNTCQSFTPYFFKKQYLEYSSKQFLSTKTSSSYEQACSLLKAIELHGRKKLSKKCIDLYNDKARLAAFVAHVWEDKPCPDKIRKVYYMINNLLETTSMDMNEPFEVSLRKFCASPVSSPTISPSVTLLVAISYIERLHKRYRDMKGSAGCSLRMIMVAYITASKYIHANLQLIIYTNSRASPETATYRPPTLPRRVFITARPSQSRLTTDRAQSPSDVSTDSETNDTQKDKDRNIRIARMEWEFLHFLNYDLSIHDPIMLVKWAQNHEPLEKTKPDKETYTSADEGDDEMDKEDDA